jgi:hypothetical protein
MLLPTAVQIETTTDTITLGSFLLHRSEALKVMVHFWEAATQRVTLGPSAAIGAEGAVGRGSGGARDELLADGRGDDDDDGAGAGGGDAVYGDGAVRARQASESAKRALRKLHEARDTGAETAAELSRQGEQLERVKGQMDAIHVDLNRADRVLKDMERPFVVGIVMPLSNIGPSGREIAEANRAARGPAEEEHPVKPLFQEAKVCVIPVLETTSTVGTMMGISKSFHARAFRFFGKESALFEYVRPAAIGTKKGSDDDEAPDTSGALEHKANIALTDVSEILVSGDGTHVELKLSDHQKTVYNLVTAHSKRLIEEIIWRTKGPQPRVVIGEGLKDFALRAPPGAKIVNVDKERVKLTSSNPPKSGVRIGKQPQQQKGSVGGGGGGGGGGGSGGSGGSGASSSNNKAWPKERTEEDMRAEIQVMKQEEKETDKALDSMLGVLAQVNQIAGGMTHELNKQSALIDDLGVSVESATDKMKTNNQRIHKLGQ